MTLFRRLVVGRFKVARAVKNFPVRVHDSLLAGGEFVVEYVLGRSGLGRGEVIERRQRLVRGRPLLGVEMAQSSSKAAESSGSFLIGALSLIGRPSG